jgi:hypothetical protein
VDGLMLRSRAQEFDDALSSGTAYPSDAVRAELSVVGRLHQAGEAAVHAPSDEFRAALRTRLLAVAAVQGVGATASTSRPAAVSWRRRAAAVGAGTMAAVVAASGVAVAGSRSLPGDPFYGVKRTTEAVQLRLADGPQDEGVRHLQFAATRLREVRALLLGGDAAPGAADADVEQRVREALTDMDADTRAGLQLLTAAFRETRATAPLEELSRFAQVQTAGLRAVLPALAGPARAQAQDSLSLVEGVQAEADGLLMLVDCTAACDPSQTAPVAPAPAPAGTTAPCGCPTPVPPPTMAPTPPPAAPADPQDEPQDEPQPDLQPADEQPTSEPSSPPRSAPPSSDAEPEPKPEPERGLPVPSLPVPSLPVPTPPTVSPVEPLGPAVQVPALPGDGLLTDAGPAMVGSTVTVRWSPVRALVAWWRLLPGRG